MSNIAIESDKLREMCNKRIKRVKEMRELEIKNLLEQELKVRNNSWFRRWFRLRPLVENDLRNDRSVQMELSIIRSGYFIIGEQVAQRLMNACNHARTVFVSTEDLYKIS